MTKAENRQRCVTNVGLLPIVTDENVQRKLDNKLNTWRVYRSNAHTSKYGLKVKEHENEQPKAMMSACFTALIITSSALDGWVALTVCVFNSAHKIPVTVALVTR